MLRLPAVIDQSACGIMLMLLRICYQPDLSSDHWACGTDLLVVAYHPQPLCSDFAELQPECWVAPRFLPDLL